MKRILVLTWVPFNKWSLKRFGFNKLNKPNYEVIVFDIGDIIFGKVNKISRKYFRNDGLKTYKFKNKNKLIRELRNQKYDIIINFANIDRSNIIFKEILKKEIKIISIVDHKLMMNLFFPKIIILYFKYFLKKMSLFFVKKNKFEIALLGGNNILNKFEAIGKKIIYSHSINYDFTLGYKYNDNNNNKNKKKIVSYIDSGYGLHPDFALKSHINKEFDLKNYSKKINLLFKILKKMGYKIYFLANPKVRSKNQKIYKNCKIIYEKPLECIRKSDLVISTNSSIIDYAVLYNKKILQIYSKEIESYPIVNRNNSFSKFFEHKTLDIGKLESKVQILDKIMYPNKKYKLYEDMFIRCKNSKKISYVNLIKKLLNE